MYRIILCLVFVFSLVAQERIGLDPVLRGVWMLHATSTDQGKTVELVKNAEGEPEPAEFCIARRSELVMADGKKIKIKRVNVVKDDDGNEANIVLLNTGRIMGITKKPNQPYVLVQVNDGEKEVSRFLITVETP